MKNIKQAVGALLAVLCLGCVSTPERPAPRLLLPELEAPREVQQRRAADFRKLTEKVKVRGAGIHVFSVRRAGIPLDELLDRIALLGFNRIYCLVSSETQLDEFFREFVIKAVNRGLPVEVVLNQRDFYFRSTGNKIVRLFRPNYLRLDDAAESVARFDAELPANTRLSGVTVIVEPHLFTATNPDIPPDSIYYWSDKTFGSDLDNAMLMKASLELLRQAKVKAGHLPLTCAAADFYHELAVEGKLPVGKVTDFCAISKRVLLLDSGNKPSEAAKVVENELAAIPRGNTALIGISLAGHTSVDNGALRRRDWNDLMRAMRYVLGRFERHPSFEGFVIAPFAALDFVRMERD